MTTLGRIAAKRRVKRHAEQALATSTWVTPVQQPAPQAVAPAAMPSPAPMVAPSLSAPEPVMAAPVLAPAPQGRPADHSYWILNGLWPPELAQTTPTTELLADRLEADLLSIAADANLALWQSAQMNPGRSEFSAEELQILNVARSLATMRVFDVVRQLRVGAAFSAGQLPAMSGYYLPR